jgi:hypothetical protein
MSRCSVRWCWSVVAVVGCASAPRAPAPERTPITRFSAPSAPTTTTGGARAELDSPPMVEASPKREDAAGSTVGTIACGNTRCRAGSELCTMRSLKWVCSPSTVEATSFYACDDASDCPAPLTCCRSFASAEEIYACSKPTEDCAALPCAEPDGMTCPQGLRCSGGYCMADFRATCDGAKQCPKEAPRCAWGSSPACITEAGGDGFGEDGSTISGIYECTRPDDCGGAQACCTSALYGEKVTHCLHQCDGANSAQLCARDADCESRARLWCGDDVRCRGAVRCAPPSTEASTGLPPWMKVCQRFDD